MKAFMVASTFCLFGISMVLADEISLDRDLKDYKQLKDQLKRQENDINELKTKWSKTNKEIQCLEAVTRQMRQIISSIETNGAKDENIISQPTQLIQNATTLVSVKLDSESDLKVFKVNRFADTKGWSLDSMPDQTGVFKLDIVPNSETAGRLILSLDVSKIEGRKLKCTAEVEGKNIETAKSTGHSGGKFMLRIQNADGKCTWPEARIGSGSFSWKTITLSHEIPFGTKSCLLIIGMEGVTSGTIWFRNLKVEILEN